MMFLLDEGLLIILKLSNGITFSIHQVSACQPGLLFMPVNGYLCNPTLGKMKRLLLDIFFFYFELLGY